MSSNSPHPNDLSGASGNPIITSSGAVNLSGDEKKGDRDRFSADELGIVLSHYDIGTLSAIREFPRGSRRAPKLLIQSDRATYLLKRRARGKDDPFKVAFTHALQEFLATKQFPLPHLIKTRDPEPSTMLQQQGKIYELFEYIKGTNYDNSLEATYDAGKTVGLFHKLVADFVPEYDTPTGTYHASKAIGPAIERIPRSLTQADPRTLEQSGRIDELVQFMLDNYNEAAKKANETGLPEWPLQICHSDWHPGNMLFRGPRVVAVIDYDAARMLQRVIDVANGALQFSIIGGGDDAAQWPDYIDESRYKRFLRGYEKKNMLSKAELRAIPYLMMEALIAESVIPIAATGSFARMEGLGFLLMVERKVKWLHANLERLMNI